MFPPDIGHNGYLLSDVPEERNVLLMKVVKKKKGRVVGLI